MSKKHQVIVKKRIIRSANISLLLKVISTASLLGLFALASFKMDPRYVYLALVPALLLWFLDAYWTQREQLYRQLHKTLASQRKSRRRTRWTFSIRDEIAKMSHPVWFKYCLEKPLLVFHGTVLTAILVVSFFVTLKRL